MEDIKKYFKKSWYNATRFGTTSARDTYLSFLIKTFLYIFPAIILGQFIDRFILSLKKNILKNKVFRIFVQTIVMVSVLYLLIKFSESYANELQYTITGIFFVVLFFGVQQFYINDIQTVLNDY